MSAPFGTFRRRETLPLSAAAPPDAVGVMAAAGCVVAAIDVGILNMAHCVLRWPEAPRQRRLRPLQAARGLLGGAEILAWQTTELDGGARRATSLPLASLLELVFGYVRLHESTFALCDVIVIEQQPAARMRNLSVALYVLLRGVAPSARIALQAAKYKLAWGGELSTLVPRCDLSLYRGRKKAAVDLTRALLSEHSHFQEASRSFDACRKKDDLGDAFLHALACCTICPAPAARNAVSCNTEAASSRRRAPARSG